MAYVFSQNELQYVYNSAKERCEAHPEIVEKYKKLLADVPVYKDRNESIRKAVSASKESNKNGQVWAKIGKDEEYFYIQVSKNIDDEKTEEREYRPFYKIEDMYPRFLFVLDMVLQKNVNGVRNVNIVDFIYNNLELASYQQI